MKFYRPNTLKTANKRSENGLCGKKYQGIIKHKYNFIILTDNDNYTIHATLYFRDELMHYNINKIKAR